MFISGSMLHAMFCGGFDTKPREDGSYFIDRDGTHFRYILNYLRTGRLIVPKDEILREELLAEAEFYQVEGMIKALTAKHFQDSVILSVDQCGTLINWLKETGAIKDMTMAGDKLLYRGSRNGWAASAFHSCCDNKGPTVTVIKSGNYIFGGYTEQEWKGKIRTSLCNKVKIKALSVSELVLGTSVYRGFPDIKCRIYSNKRRPRISAASGAMRRLFEEFRITRKNTIKQF